MSNKSLESSAAMSWVAYNLRSNADNVAVSNTERVCEDDFESMCTANGAKNEGDSSQEWLLLMVSPVVDDLGESNKLESNKPMNGLSEAEDKVVKSSECLEPTLLFGKTDWEGLFASVQDNLFDNIVFLIVFEIEAYTRCSNCCLLGAVTEWFDKLFVRVMDRLDIAV